MKYIKYLRENQEVELAATNIEQFKDDIEKIFENNTWLVIKPKSYEALCYWGRDTEWRLADTAHRWKFHPNYTYINIEKDENRIYLFDLNDDDFFDKDEEQIYLKEFFENNSELIKVYIDLIGCSHVVKENNEYWLTVSDYDYFENYFKLDRNTRSDLVKLVLGGDSYDIFNYSPSDFELDDYGLKVNDENLELLKIVLRLEKAANEEDYDYDVNTVEDYDDVVSIIDEYDLEELKDILRRCICTGHESASASEAWESIVNEIYKFFDLVDGSAKWVESGVIAPKNKYSLWLKFKTPESAFYAKIRIGRFDSEFADDDYMIEYSPPYYGYNGETKDVVEVFNSEIPERLTDYDSDNVSYDEISDYEEYWKKAKEEHPDFTDEQLEEEVEFFLKAKKYNL